MTIKVNGVEITEAQIANEQVRQTDTPSPRDAAIQQLILHELLRTRAREEGFDDEDEHMAIAKLLDKELNYQPVDQAACREFYDQHPEYFQQSESASAAHILFANEGDALAGSLVKAKAEGILNQLKTDLSQFETLAKEHSACPSGQQGGNLGVFGRGQMVPEFEQAVFSTEAGALVPELVETQFGWHIILVRERHEKQQVPFEEVEESLRQHLGQIIAGQVMHDYLSKLVAVAKIEGYQMPTA